jgi:hypothetical protein
MSTRPWIKPGKSAIDSIQDLILRRCVGIVTPVQPITAPELGIGANFISTTLGPCSKG